jgi:hypothetical protein
VKVSIHRWSVRSVAGSRISSSRARKAGLMLRVRIKRNGGSVREPAGTERGSGHGSKVSACRNPDHGIRSKR